MPPSHRSLALGLVCAHSNCTWCQHTLLEAWCDSGTTSLCLRCPHPPRRATRRRVSVVPRPSPPLRPASPLQVSRPRRLPARGLSLAPFGCLARAARGARATRGERAPCCPRRGAAADKGGPATHTRASRRASRPAQAPGAGKYRVESTKGQTDEQARGNFGCHASSSVPKPSFAIARCGQSRFVGPGCPNPTSR